jgi:Brp/Blh family beta-carotene 15,15'-monooxygenase
VTLAATIMDARFLRVLAGFVVLFLLLGAGVPLEGASATAWFCLLLLLVGLPHGALDIERLKSAARAGWQESLALFLLYLALAGATYAAWVLSPVLALGLFLLCAVLHFSEDWESMDDPLLALGTATALLASPALLHKDALGAIFAVVAGKQDGALLAEGLRVIAPVALALAVAGMIGLVRARKSVEAGCCVLVLAAMLFAPPIAGFVVYFCLYHSPIHLREAWLAVRASRRWRLAVGAGLTAASAGIAAVLAQAQWRGSLDDSLLAATFITFSVLTVPHMLAPLIVERWRKTKEREPAA